MECFFLFCVVLYYPPLYILMIGLNRIQLRCVNEKKTKMPCVMKNTRSDTVFTKNTSYDIMVQRFTINNRAIPLFIPTIKEPMFNIFESNTITPQGTITYSEKMTHYINGSLVNNVFTQPFQIMIECNGNTYGSFVPFIPPNISATQPTCKYNTPEFFTENYFYCHSSYAFPKMLTQTLENIIECANGALDFLLTMRFTMMDGSLISLVIPESAYTTSDEYHIYFNHDLERMLGFTTNKNYETDGSYEMEVLENETITQRIPANTFIINNAQPMAVITENYSSSHLFPWSKLIFTTPMGINPLMTYSNATHSVDFPNNTIPVLTDYVFTSVALNTFYDRMDYNPTTDNRKIRYNVGDHDVKTIAVTVLLESQSGITIPLLLNPDDSAEMLIQLEEF